MSGENKGVDLLAVRFRDLKVKQFISTCSTILPDEPRKTKHHGLVPRPQVAENYLKMSAGIDIHNHVRTGSMGLEDAWQTKNYIHRQFAGVLGFVFSNAYLAMRYFYGKRMSFKLTNGDHSKFKILLVNQLLSYEGYAGEIVKNPVKEVRKEVHNLVRLDNTKRKQARCFYCQHAHADKRENKTAYYCEGCGKDKPLCAATTDRDCFAAHITHGLPGKKYRK